MTSKRSKLAPCPDCGTDVSRAAKACPKCGRSNPVSKNRNVNMLQALAAIFGVIVLGYCFLGPDEQQQTPSPVAAVTPQGTAPALEAAPAPALQDSRSSAASLTREEVVEARKLFSIEVISFDASQRYGVESPYADRVRLRIMNGSSVILPCLTVQTHRFSNGKPVGSSRLPAITTRDLKAGETAEVDYYAKGHLDVVAVDRIEVEIESLWDPEEEQFFCELQRLRK